MSINDTIAVVRLSNPPVNALNHVTRSIVAENIKEALADKVIQAILLIGDGNLFSGGADIREFDSSLALAEPSLHALIELVENSSKPVIAALHGACVGGGLELALACHYRIAAPTTRIGLPEVRIGLLPGAGGTQRLPRAIGLRTALHMITSGDLILAEQLISCGLIDELIAGDLVNEAHAFAMKIKNFRPLPLLREREMNDLKAVDDDNLMSTYRHSLFDHDEYFAARMKCIEAVNAAMTMPFQQGIELEQRLFMALLQTTESKALRKAFFSKCRTKTGKESV